MTLPSRVKIVEVGPRDGLQNEKQVVPTDIKVELIDRLAEAGLKVIEATSFVSPKWVPQMGDNSAVLAGIQRRPGVTYTALTPNLQGFDGAVQAAQANEVAIFGCRFGEFFAQEHQLLHRREPEALRTGGFGCLGAGNPGARLCFLRRRLPVRRCHCIRNRSPASRKTLFDMGCYEVSLGDTIGVGNPASVQRMIEACAQRMCRSPSWPGTITTPMAWPSPTSHASLQTGMAVFDASVAGLGRLSLCQGRFGQPGDGGRGLPAARPGH